MITLLAIVGTLIGLLVWLFCTLMELLVFKDSDK